MELIVLLIVLFTVLIIGYILFRQNKKILNNQETIMLELNKLSVAIKHPNES